MGGIGGERHYPGAGKKPARLRQGSAAPARTLNARHASLLKLLQQLERWQNVQHAGTGWNDR